MSSLWHYRLSLAAFALTMVCSTAAQAQYIWLNEKGVKQYSDMPPAASVPQKRILKEPGTPSRSSRDAVDEASGDQEAAAPADGEKAPMTLAEKNAEFQKRRMEQAEKDKKAAEQARYEEAKAKNCARASIYQRSLQSGQRIARSDTNGERYFLDDSQRAQEIRDNQRILDGCK